ncbi:glutamate dehydrogenase [Salsuginibacillus halophilus]|uniref:Glutamate dehydrogenase n=1 Tax=Salsuginibacillus halophilus TaxID=517424 RepID=A0A2P8HYI4_9BACI|nr:Glu/Leu/Phe/Val dehydrogenase [Salsuginibacillus halophilus]PSL51291.1 glutamate dehydrogenase [Salsuginibacillus halophilus]
MTNENEQAEADITSQNDNPLHIVHELMKDSVQSLGYSDNVFRVLEKPLRLIEVSMRIRMNDGSIKNFTGYRSQHLDIFGPTKGGIRFHPSVTRDEVKALSIWMSLKSAILGLPLGGGKGGIIVNPEELTSEELEDLSRAYIRKLTPVIGPQKDIPAPDVNTNPEVMGWMMDEYDQLRGYNIPGMLTGKPLILGGSAGRLAATGRGVVLTIREAADVLNMDLSTSTAAIQGFGNVGSMTAKYLAELDVTVVAISEASGAIYQEDGIDIHELLEFIESGGVIGDYDKAEQLDPEEIFGLEVDIFIPAALENQITEKTAGQMQAKIVAEAANGPTTPAGDKVLEDKDVFVIPDILCNAGGVTVSYFEWVQNEMNYYWSEEDIHNKLEERMVDGFHNVLHMRNEKSTRMRQAAYMVGVAHIAEGLSARGWVKPGDLHQDRST